MSRESRIATAVANLSSQWSASGIEPGDTVVLHSSLKRTLTQLNDEGEKITPADILDSFLYSVGPEGTLVFPTFNFGFAFGESFDRKRTPSHMGILGETARLDARAYRTAHPIYSFAIIGALKNIFMGKDNYSAWGQDSPFAIVKELNGKVAILDVPDRHSMTYFHYVEEALEVPFRFHKQFRGSYIDFEGQAEERVYSLFVRDIDAGVIPCLDNMGQELWMKGIYTGSRPGEEAGLRVGSAVEIFDVVSSAIKSGRAEGLLYTIDHEIAKSQKTDWNKTRNQ